MITLGDTKERMISEILKIIDHVEIYDHDLDPHDDNYGRPTCDEMRDSFEAICQIKMMFPKNIVNPRNL